MDLDRNWALLSDPIILQAEHINARANRMERMGIRLQPGFIIGMDLANAAAAKRRNELGLPGAGDEL